MIVVVKTNKAEELRAARHRANVKAGNISSSIKVAVGNFHESSIESISPPLWFINRVKMCREECRFKDCVLWDRNCKPCHRTRVLGKPGFVCPEGKFGPAPS